MITGNFYTNTGLSGSSGASYTNKRLDELETQVDGVEAGLDSLQTEVDELSTTVNTETVNASSLNATVVDTTTLSSDSASFDTADIGIINSATIENSGSITTDGLIAETVTANTISGQLTDAQGSLTVTNLTATDLDVDNIDADNIVTDSLTTNNLTLETIQADEATVDDLTATTGDIETLTSDTATITTGNVTTLTSEDHTTDRLVVNSTATIHAVNVETSNVETANVDVLVNAKHTGTLSLNLDPVMSVSDDYYLLKIKKNFNRLNFKVDGSLDITILNAYEDASTTTSTTPMVLSHLYSLDNVVLYSMDDEYIYVEISPKDDTDLIYSYEADTEVEDIITASLNEEVEFEWYYKPEAISEVIFLGTAEHPYQVTILGKLKAAIAPTFDNYEFDDITINKNIYVKDYYDTEGSVWVYKTGTVNDYLSNIEDYVDEQGIQHYRVDWRERVHFRDPSEYIVETEDETDDNGRVTKANIDTLIDTGTLRYYNGQWIVPSEATGRMIPPYTIVYNDTEYSNILEDEWTTLFSDPMDFSSRPALNETMAAMVKISDYGETIAEKTTYYTRIYDDFPTLLANKGWTSTTESSATVYTAPYTTDDGWIEAIYAKKNDETTFYLIDEIRIESDGSTPMYSNGTYITSYRTSCIIRNISTTASSSNVEVTGTEEMSTASTVNPITKLGTVDEGNWNEAGYVYSDDVKVVDGGTGLTIEPESITWKMGSDTETFDVWDYAEDDLSWVEV